MVAMVSWVIRCDFLSISTVYPWHECMLVIFCIHDPCWTRWRVGTWLLNFVFQNMSQPMTKNYDGEPEKGSHLSSSDDETMKTDFYKKSKVTTSNWPRFLVSSTVEGALMCDKYKTILVPM